MTHATGVTAGPDALAHPLSKVAQAALLACGFFTTVGLFSPGLVLPQIEQTFAEQPYVGLLTQLVGAVASFSFAVAAPFAGTLVTRFGCRAVILWSLVLFALVGSAPLVFDELWSILVSRVLVGVTFAGIFAAALTGIGALEPAQRARMLGWFSMVGGVAAIVIFPAIGALARVDWHWAFGVHASALLVIPLAIGLPRKLGVVRVTPVIHTTAPAPGLLTPRIVGVLALAALSGTAMLIASIYAPLYLASLGVTDTRLFAIPVTLGSAAAVVTSAVYGTLHRSLGINGVFAVMMIVMGLALLLSGVVENLPLFTVGIVLQAAALGALAPNVSAAALAFSPPERASQMVGLANGVMFGSQLLFPFIASAVRAAAGIAGVFVAFGGCALLVGLWIGARHLSARRAVVPSPS